MATNSAAYPRPEDGTISQPNDSHSIGDVWFLIQEGRCAYSKLQPCKMLYQLHPKEFPSSGNADRSMYFLSLLPMLGKKKADRQVPGKGKWEVVRADGTKEFLVNGATIRGKTYHLKFHQHGQPTDWIMIEHRLAEDPSNWIMKDDCCEEGPLYQRASPTRRLSVPVLCVVKHKRGRLSQGIALPTLPTNLTTMNSMQNYVDSSIVGTYNNQYQTNVPETVPNAFAPASTGGEEFRIHPSENEPDDQWIQYIGSPKFDALTAGENFF